MSAKEFRRNWILDPSKEMIVEHEIMQAYADQEVKPYKERIKLLEFMVDNGLGEEDMRNDI